LPPATTLSDGGGSRNRALYGEPYIGYPPI
jgi:hypothetical protein